MTKKIRDNPSIQELASITEPASKIFHFLDKIPFFYRCFPKLNEVKEEFRGIEEQMYLCDLPDQFNSTFAEHGWIAYDSMPLDVMKESIKLAKEVNLEQALNYMVNSYNEKSIDHIILRAKSRDHFEKRVRLLNLAKKDYLAERYHACIPLLLSLIDGLAGDISKHVGFFAENSNFELFDSIVGHRSGLPFLKTIMNTSGKMTNEEAIYTPYRNGILHGRALNFDNKTNAAKCWMTLACLIDWADGFANPKQPKETISLIDSLRQLGETRKITERIDIWTPRSFPADTDWTKVTREQLTHDLPEYVLLDFMEYWQKKQWGKMVPLLQHCLYQHPGQAALEVKNDYSKVILDDFTLLEVKDDTPAITDVKLDLSILRNEIKHKVSVRLIYIDQKGLPLLRGELNGKWSIIQNGFSSILYPSTE